jgi:hypothetical protein|tara:strand:- start:2307 stop:4403 length:2097 start_codon:yes stop_codon:yes gene_type:complete
MDNQIISEELTYVSKKPNVTVLRNAYERTTTELSSFFDLCRASYDDRRNFWAGKSPDLRKHGADAFPWEGASDMESHVIDERISRLVSLFVASLSRANIRAFPVSSDDMGRARVVSSFLKWMVSSGYIPRFKKEMELGANYLLERGLLISYVGWHREDRRIIQELTVEQIAGHSQEAMDMFMSGYADEEVEQVLMLSFEGLTKKKAKKAVQELRKKGVAQLPVVRRQVNAPEIKTLSPDGDFFFPSYVTDPQRAPFCFWRTYYTAQELQNKIVTDGWDEGFVDYIIEHFRGANYNGIERNEIGSPIIETNLTNSVSQADELIEVIHGYQRLIDEEDNSEGIYETIFHRSLSSDTEVQPYAKFELMNGYEDYPVVVTKLSEDSKRLYDTNTIPSLLRGIQNQVKIERDSRVDRNSWATLPPLMHPKGQAPLEYGPGRFIPYRRKGDIEFAPSPPSPTGSVEIENTLEQQADRLVGLDDSIISQTKKQFLVDKFLSHSAEVLKLAYKCFQRFGPDEIFFKVTGVPDPQTMNKGDPMENFDIIVNYDVLNTDPETQEKKLQQFIALSQMDRNGRLSMDRLLELSASAIDPVLADGMIMPAKEAQEDIRSDITDDLSKLYAGIEVPARPNGAQFALQAIQQYAQQPDITERLQSDEGFKARLEKYAQQYNFQMQQSQNAEIGKIGTAPSSMGSMNTQTMNQQ